MKLFIKNTSACLPQCANKDLLKKRLLFLGSLRGLPLNVRGYPLTPEDIIPYLDLYFLKILVINNIIENILLVFLNEKC